MLNSLCILCDFSLAFFAVKFFLRKSLKDFSKGRYAPLLRHSAAKSHAVSVCAA